MILYREEGYVMLISKTKVKQYLLVYLLIILNYSMLYYWLEDFILVGCFVISTLVILNRMKYQRKEDSLYILWVIALSISLFSTSILTNGSLSFASIVNMLSRVLFVYAIIQCLGNKIFLEYYLNIGVFLCVVSLIFEIITFTPLYEIIKHQMIVTPNQWGLYRGVFIYVLRSKNSAYQFNRNLMLFGEPGVTQMLLISMIYCLVFKIKEKNRYDKAKLLVVLITLITTQSTTGYFNLIILLLGYIVIARGNQRKEVLLLWLILGIVIGCSLYFSGEDSFLYTNFLDKFTRDNKIDFSVSSGRARIVSMQTDLIMITEKPWGWGFRDYLASWRGYLTEYIFEPYSVSGITKSVAAYGIPTCLVLFAGWLYQAWTVKNNVVEWIVYVGIMINTLMGQPQICYPVLMVLSLLKSENSIGDTV